MRQFLSSTASSPDSASRVIVIFPHPHREVCSRPLPPLPSLNHPSILLNSLPIPSHHSTRIAHHDRPSLRHPRLLRRLPRVPGDRRHRLRPAGLLEADPRWPQSRHGRLQETRQTGKPASNACFVPLSPDPLVGLVWHLRWSSNLSDHRRRLDRGLL